MQAEHESTPKAEAVPARQVDKVPSAVQDEPAGQSVQEVAPGPELNCPEGQAVQPSEGVEPLCSPAMHSVAAVTVQEEPAGQASQEARPLLGA